MAAGNLLNLDTHIALFALADQLSTREQAILTAAEWGISAIVIWEIGRLARAGRITVGLEHPKMAAFLDAVTIWSIDDRVATAATRLDVRSDPADELIAATSIVHEVPLVTRDRELRRSRAIPLAV